MAVVYGELLLRARLFNTATPGSTVELLPLGITVTDGTTILTVYCCFSASGVLSVERTVGGVTVSEKLNSGDALDAGCAYMFDVSIQSDTTINFKYSAGTGTTYIFVVDQRTI